MRLTLVLPHADLSGGIRVLAIYAGYLASRGHQVVAISTPRHKPPLLQAAKSWLRGRGWPRPRHGEPSHFDGVPIEHQVLDCFRPVRDRDVPDADVVLATWWQTAEWVAALAPAKGAKAYLVQHDERVMLPPQDLAGRQRVAATWSLPLTKITVAGWLVELLAPHAQGGRVHLVPNGVDPHQFHAPPRAKQTRPTVGMMYARSAYKGCDAMLQAVRLAAERVPGLKLVGFGTQQPERSGTFPPETDYRLCPPQDELRKIYAGCDAWLFGSRWEGFGLPILEAMACRTPVIGTPAGAAPELLAQGGGLLVEHDRPQAMARAIEHVAALTTGQWRALSDAAWATAARHTWPAAAAQFEAALMTVARPQRPETQRAEIPA